MYDSYQAVAGAVNNRDDDIKVEIKSLMLRQQLEKKMLNIILDDVRQKEDIREVMKYEDGLNRYLRKNMATLDEVF